MKGEMDTSYYLIFSDSNHKDEVREVGKILEDGNLDQSYEPYTVHGVWEYAEAIVVSVTASASYDLMKYVIYNTPSLNVVEFDREDLLQNISFQSGEAAAVMSIINIENVEGQKGRFFVEVHSRNYVYRVTCNRKGKIYELNKSSL
ncbi:hypothetical protein EQV77_10595 [Halobacillus fulvus]|nr:hypothetical protein EQV77_10595 [Halobacillus fulvus]